MTSILKHSLLSYIFRTYYYKCFNIQSTKCVKNRFSIKCYFGMNSTFMFLNRYNMYLCTLYFNSKGVRIYWICFWNSFIVLLLNDFSAANLYFHFLFCEKLIDFKTNKKNFLNSFLETIQSFKFFIKRETTYCRNSFKLQIISVVNTILN